MKMHDLFVVIVAILLAAGVALSRQSGGSSEGADPIQSTNPPSSRSPRGDLHTRIVSVKYYPVDELSRLIRTLSQGEASIVANERSNQLILTASEERMKDILQVIAELDQANVNVQQTQYLTYRVYMLELPSKDQNLKPFSVLLERSSQLSPGQVLNAAKEANVQIGALFQDNRWMEDDKWGLVIQGRAASNDALGQLLTKISDSQVRELRWDDDTFTSAVPAAQVSALPGQLQEHIRKFLGAEVQTVGYWFGGLSVPGNVEAPIGLWKIEMKTQSGQGANLVLEVRVSRESHIQFVPSSQLLSNTVQARVGRPVIVGYNRDSYGTRVMGAMVVLLEADTTAPTTVEMKQQ